MKKILVLSILSTGLLILPALAADNQIQKGTVSVSYTAEKEVSPDTAEFSISIKTSDKKLLNEAANKNKDISNKVYEYLKSKIDTASGDYIKTSNYSATPIYSYNNGKRVFDRYEVSNNIIVHTKSLDKISALIDKSVGLGATDVNSLNFTLSNKDQTCVDMLSQASKQARKRADIVAQSVGTTVEGIKDIRTSCSLNQRRTNLSYSNIRLMKSAGAGVDSAPEAASTDIEAGSIIIYTTVDADFYVK